jgi:hypothetical protein
MVLRQIGSTPSERAKNIEDSVELAKQAVQMDITDGRSWCMFLSCIVVIHVCYGSGVVKASCTKNFSYSHVLMLPGILTTYTTTYLT